MGSVFISYRREDSEGQARALFQDLAAWLGRDAVFMDVDSIALGRDFREVLQERLASCDLMLVLIGRDWLEGRDASGRRRLDDPADFVRLEILAGLKRRIPITPLLVQGARMPAAAQLPEDMADLAWRTGFELSHTRWDSDVRELLKRLGLDAAPAAGAAAAAPAPPSGVPRTSHRTWYWVAGGVAIALVLGVGDALLNRRSPPTAAAGGPTEPTESARGPRVDSTPAPGAPKAAPQARHEFPSADARLAIATAGSYKAFPFTVANLEPGRDFSLEFEIGSSRSGGSTRYGIAWNYSPDDFLLFTLHSTDGGYFSIGPGRSSSRTPWSRFAQGVVAIRAESGFDTLQITRSGANLVFAVNGQEVWRTRDLGLTSPSFAFWVADFSEASIRSYTLRQ